jgi:hypothetical protein
MAPRRRTNDTDVSAAQRCLTESSKDVWERWSHDRERRQLQRKINAELEAREAANQPIYPRECCERIAQETYNVAPDWRHIRPTLGPAWGRLLKAQPELTPDLTRQREAAITAVFNAAPPHLRESVRDLRVLIDLLLVAHEAAAYQVGWESRAVHDRHADQLERACTTKKQNPREGELRLTLALPSTGNRLHDKE